MFTVYKVTNKIDNKFYIGVHKTDNPNDGYFGSGKAIRNAIAKYGKENFTKEILFVTEHKQEAYNLEKELTSGFLDRNNYNMRLGGVGGFTRENAYKGYINGIAKLTNEKRTEIGKRSYLENLANLDHVKNGSKGGKANKGIPKSPKHIAAIKAAWERKKLISFKGNDNV